jgi:hypothetical protein
MKIKFELFVKNYRGGPDVKIYSGKKLLKSTKLSNPGPQTIEVEDDVNCPTELVLLHHGKHMKRDTKLVDGKIVDDKGFVLKKVHVGKIILENELYLFDFIKDDGSVLKNNNYIGYNGRYVIDINSNNLTMWYIKLQQSLTNHLPDFDYDEFKKEIFNDETYEVIY